MRRFVSMLFAAVVPCAVAFVFAGDVHVQAVRDKREIGVAQPERVATKLIAIAESCSVDSTAYAVSDGTWATVLGSGSFVRAVFSTPRRSHIWDRNSSARKERMVAEVLFPLPMDRDPPHIFLRIENQIISLTKYDPRALRELALENDLQLRGSPRYDFLLRPGKK
jgi:hypothetical protein